MPKLTFYGHACFRVDGADGSVIFDPFLTGNPLAAISAGSVAGIQAVLLTHGHGDHLGDGIDLAKKNNATIVAPFELASFCQMQGADVHPMHIGGSHQFPWGWVKLTPAWHGSALVDENGIQYTGNPCGFVLRIQGKTIYHAGDTGLFGDMKLIGEMHPIHVALIPIGDNFVMGPEDAVKAVEFIKPKKVIPMHYNTFPVIEQDPQEFKKQVEETTNTECIVLQPGETLEV